MKDLVLYVHGRGGAASEAARYAPLFPGREVVGLDYRGATPWEAGAEVREALEARKKRCGRVTLIANSIGAYYCMHAGVDRQIEKAYFISPIVDMEALIRGMMARSGVTEEALRARGVIPAGSGEALSWEYLCYVRSHPIRWDAPTEILYGEADALTPYQTAAAFAAAHGAGLTVMPGGEHWFHTDAQLRFLDDWLRRCEGRAITQNVNQT